MADLIRMGDDGTLNVPDEPIIPFIEGDGTGVDIWPAAKLVLDAAAAKHGHTIAWKEVLAGQKAFDETGNWLPDETVDTFRAPDRHQGPADHADRRRHPLASTWPCARSSTSTCACARCAGSRACRRRCMHPELVDMVIFRENTEDVYAGYEVQSGTPEAEKLADLPARRDGLAHPGGLGHRHQADLAPWAPSA